jgi:hypothetical protein
MQADARRSEQAVRAQSLAALRMQLLPYFSTAGNAGTIVAGLLAPGGLS